MNKIFKIFLVDAKRIKTNVVAIVMIIGLSVLPSLYAWFNILSNWDPYGPAATSNIMIAVASEDEGVSFEEYEYNVGDTIVNSLKANDSVGWVFVDSSYEAVEGVKNGNYYAALVLPKDFSKNMVSFLVGDIEHPTIQYYRNEKKNAIAPKITDKVRNAVELQINTEFISTIAKGILGISDSVIEGDSEYENAGNQNIIDSLYTKLGDIDSSLANFEVILDSLVLVFDNASSSTDALDQAYPDINQALVSGQLAMGNLEDAASVGAVSATGISGLSDGFSGMSYGLKLLREALEASNGNMSEISGLLAETKESLVTTREGVTSIRESIQEKMAAIDSIRDGDAYNMVTSLFQNNPEDIGEFLASPVAIETQAIYPVMNYGSAMAPFYTVLALWVGALIMVAVVHVSVHDEPEFAGAKPRHKYFGRYIIFFIVTQIQALITTLGNIYYIGIQCEHPFLFWLAAAMSSFVFSIFMYSLTVAFGNIGEGIAVIVMVIQVAGAGGTFPIETLPNVYQAIYRFLPFPYAMNAMREAVAGMYGMEYQKDIFILSIYAIISLVIGLAIAIPFRRLNKIIEHSKEKSGVML